METAKAHATVSRNMKIFVPIFGGLGNQMFQAAHAMQLERLSGFSVCLLDFTKQVGQTRRSWGLSSFGIEPTSRKIIDKLSVNAFLFQARVARKLGSVRRFGVHDEVDSVKLRPALSETRVCVGYWQGLRFFKLVEKDVNVRFSSLVSVTQADSSQPNLKGQSVAVHIRRGDYVSSAIGRSAHLVCDEAWYLKAMQELRSRLDAPTFYLFSDDDEWVRQTYGAQKDVVICESAQETDPARLLQAIASAEHFIISNSTFSWWASYLGHKKTSLTVAPKYWHPGVLTQTTSLMRNDWILV